MVADAQERPTPTYRYTLHRELRAQSQRALFDPGSHGEINGQIHADDVKRALLFIMLNPSTATETEDDPTVRRCIGFGNLWGMETLEVCNLFAVRSTDPRKLTDFDDPVGPENDKTIREAVQRSGLIIVAWGKWGTLHGRDQDVLRLIQDDCARTTLCLARNQDGTPMHPLYVPERARPVPYSKLRRIARAAGIR